MPLRRLVVSSLLLAAAPALAGCATTAPTVDRSAPAAQRVVTAAASINAWGSILAQLGGVHVRAASIITDPATDPHDYEPTPADARTVAAARLFVLNGVGYDTWAAKAVSADPDSGRTVLDVGSLLGVAAGGNPHLWYSPAAVDTVADRITADLSRLDPADSAYFAARRAAFGTTALSGYRRLVAQVRHRYAGVPIGASESVVVPLADALGLRLLTPATFLRAVSEGADPRASDKVTIDRQISSRAIKVYVVNTQNSTPDVSAQVTAAKAAGIPVVGVTETLSPRGATFQAWQTAQLRALEHALAQATGR